MTRVLLHADSAAALAPRLVARFPDAVAEICTAYEPMNDLVPAFRPDVVYSIRFAGTPGFPAAVLTGEGGPAWIAVGGSGTDHLGHWDTAHTTVTNAAGVAAAMMAEYVLGGFLHFTLDMLGLEADKQARVWRTRKMTPLNGKTLLIVGLGHTGRALAERASAFGMHVVGTRARPEPTPAVDEVHPPEALPALWPRADFIAVCTPLLAATRGLVGAEALAAMKPTAILADVSRGGVVDQAALAEALAAGRIAGAVLDVFETEPLPAENPLWSLSNVVISPHCSSVFEGWEDASFDLFLDNLERWRSGEPLRNVVDPQRGY